MQKSIHWTSNAVTRSWVAWRPDYSLCTFVQLPGRVGDLINTAHTSGCQSRVLLQMRRFEVRASNLTRNLRNRRPHRMTHQSGNPNTNHRPDSPSPNNKRGGSSDEGRDGTAVPGSAPLSFR